MKTYIRENIKSIISITLLIIATTVFICTNELVAKRLPDVSELTQVTCELSGDITYEYTGLEVKPLVCSVLYIDKDNNFVTLEEGNFTVISYYDNIEIGSGSVELKLDGYNGTIILSNVFNIQPARINELSVSHESKESIDLSWEKPNGAEGYIIYKSKDNGNTFDSIQAIMDADITSYQDKNITSNTTYFYKVNVFMSKDDAYIKGADSNVVSQLTRLDTPVMISAACSSFDSIIVEWEPVAGAAGYQIFRSIKSEGPFDYVGEVMDGAITSYEDKSLECGNTYFYHIKACQALETGNIYTENSNVLSAQTIPNQVRLNGSVSDVQTQVTLSWKKTPGAQGYEIFKSVGSASNYQLVSKIEQEDICSWVDTGLNKDTECYYKVRAYRVVNGETIYGNYSNYFLKEVVIVYNYSGSSSDVNAITQYAGKVPYVWGGKSSKGWDCSGFTSWVYKNHFGIDISKSVAGQARTGVSVSKNDRSAWKPGDILVYSEGAGASHVAIYLGDGQLIHALSEKYDTIIHGVDYYERWDRATYMIDVRRIFN